MVRVPDRVTLKGLVEVLRGNTGIRFTLDDERVTTMSAFWMPVEVIA